MKVKNKYTLQEKNNFVSFFYPRDLALTYNQIFEMLWTLLRPRIIKQRLRIFPLKKITKCVKSNININSNIHETLNYTHKKIHLKKSNYHQ